MRYRYPFEALHWLRHQRVEQHAAAVSESAARTARARREEARAATARQDSEASLSELSRIEGARLSAGQSRAGDLQVVGDWRQGAEAELQAKAELLVKARAARLSEAAAEGGLRRALGQASNEARAVDAHRQAFREARAAASERADEEVATEQWSARRFPPKQA